MLNYASRLKTPARTLRKEMTDAEQLLWSRLRRKQILDVQFYRQKPLGPFIVDFYCPAVALVIEVDGSQHLSPGGQAEDARRDQFLAEQGLTVLRFDNLQVLREIDGVMQVIFEAVQVGKSKSKSPQPPFAKGGLEQGDADRPSSPPTAATPPFEKGGPGGISPSPNEAAAPEKTPC